MSFESDYRDSQADTRREFDDEENWPDPWCSVTRSRDDLTDDPDDYEVVDAEFRPCVVCGGLNCTHERDEFNEKIRQAAMAALGQTRRDWWV